MITSNILNKLRQIEKRKQLVETSMEETQIVVLEQNDFE